MADLRTHLTGRRNFTVILLIALAMVVLFWVVLHSVFGRNNGSQIQYAQHLDPEGISVSTDMRLATGGDANKNKRADGGDGVTVSFTIHNQSKQAARTVTLDTGMSKDSIAYAHNFKGTTGFDATASTLTFKNIVVLPGQSQQISFDVQTLFSSDNQQLKATPKLSDPSGKSVLQGKQKTIAVSGSEHVPSLVKAEQGGP